MTCSGLQNDYSGDSASEHVLFPWSPNLSLLPIPNNFTVFFFSLPEGLFHLDLVFLIAIVSGSQDKERGQVLSILLNWAKPEQKELEILGAKL